MKNAVRGGQALILAALIVAATIYTMYALTLTYSQTQTQPTQAEVYTEAINQALAEASKTQNTTLAAQLYQQYISQAQAVNQYLNISTELQAQPTFQYYGYNKMLCVGCNTTATASVGPYTVAVNLTLVSKTQTRFTLKLSYMVDGKNTPIYNPQIQTSTPAQVYWEQGTIIVLAQTSSTFTLTVTTPWGLVLTCLL